MGRRAAKIDGLTPVEGLWDEVFTGLDHPKTLSKGETLKLPLEIAAGLIKAKAAKNV